MLRPSHRGLGPANALCHVRTVIGPGSRGAQSKESPAGIDPQFGRIAQSKRGGDFDYRDKLVRFAHWNIGMLDLWNDGFKANRTQGAFSCIYFFCFDGVLYGAKAENGCSLGITKMLKQYFFVE
jgi:hypothetical protein